MLFVLLIIESLVIVSDSLTHKEESVAGKDHNHADGAVFPSLSALSAIYFTMAAFAGAFSTEALRQV